MFQTVLLFIFGLAFGSFLNVLALRYDPDKFLFSKKVVGGRSHCPHCKRVLRWFELFPLFSFIALRGRCRTCKAKISFQYPIVELLSGILFVLPVVPPIALAGLGYSLWAWQALWVVAFLGLLLMSIIDIRLQIIPDEFHAWFIGVGALLIYLTSKLVEGGHSFIGGYAMLLGATDSIWLNHVIGGLAGGLFFLALVLITKGRGMGIGDVKLGLSLGFLLGWPDIFLAIFLAFIIGSIYGVGVIIFNGMKLKSKVPFAPFLAISSVIVILAGEAIVRGYFGLFGL